MIKTVLSASSSFLVHVGHRVRSLACHSHQHARTEHRNILFAHHRNRRVQSIKFSSQSLSNATDVSRLVYGVDTGIIATTIAHDSFKLYMYDSLDVPSELTGAIVSCYYAGNCIGSFGSGALMDRWGRKSLVYLATVAAIVGTAIQAGSINVGMMIASRAVAGLATGALLTIVPIYIAELAPPENRAYLVALKGLLTAIGYLVANWIGYAGSFAQGDVQWRIPLAMQLPPAMLLLALTVFLPDSPRWRKSSSFPRLLTISASHFSTYKFTKSSALHQ